MSEVKVFSINKHNQNIKILGCPHYGYTRRVRKEIREFNPDVICAEVKLGLESKDHAPEVREAEKLSNRISCELWHIDLAFGEQYETELENKRREDNLRNFEDKISSDNSRIGQTRDKIRDNSEDMYEDILQRESAMMGTIEEAISRYNKVFVLVGTVHSQRLYTYFIS